MGRSARGRARGDWVAAVMDVGVTLVVEGGARGTEQGAAGVAGSGRGAEAGRGGIGSRRGEGGADKVRSGPRAVVAGFGMMARWKRI